MSEENNVDQVEATDQVETDTPQEANEEVADTVTDPVEKAVQERLAKMKANMDRMARERDEAMKKAAEFEQRDKHAKIKALEDEGKYREAAEMKLSEMEAKLKVYEEENTRLNRDSVLSSVLTGLEFKNERSREMAYRDIVDQLVQNEAGQWLHKSGITIKDFVESYSKNADNEFLFRIKTNSGTGMNNTAGTPSMDTPKKLSEMSQEDVLRLASKGQLGSFSY